MERSWWAALSLASQAFEVVRSGCQLAAWAAGEWTLTIVTAKRVPEPVALDRRLQLLRLSLLLLLRLLRSMLLLGMKHEVVPSLLPRI